MTRLWLFFFPLLFIPNLGFSQQTPFGSLDVSDWLIVPFLILLIVVPSARFEQRVSKLNVLLWSFLAWALLSILSIHFRFNYVDDVPILIGSALKLAKLVLYAVGSVVIAKKLSDRTVRERWLWSLLAALFMLSVGLLASGGDLSGQSNSSPEGYKSFNAIIVSVAILCSYIAGLWIERASGRNWNRCAIATVVFAVSSVLLSSSLTSHGRGGWVAFAAGFGYIFWKRTRNLKVLAIIVIVGFASLTAYEVLPTFRSLVDMTLSPTEGSGAESLDDGGRVSTWANEAPKLINAPLFGAGFYHRGGNSGLWATGSHNFFIQMFLETGVVGGCLMLLIFALAWRHAGSTRATQNRIGIATRAALTAAIVGGMSGEYYYGGTGVLVLFAVLAIASSLPAATIGVKVVGAMARQPTWRTT